MGTLYLVRHGQASFGAQDYDQLSELGQRQSWRLGEHFQRRGLRFERVLTGTLKRHQQTLAGICGGGGYTVQAEALPGLDEYDSLAVIAAVHPEPLAKPDTPELYRHHFRLLREGLAQWMAGRVRPRGMPSYPEFQQGVADALALVRQHSEGDVLLVSSGGPISTAVGQVLGTAPQATIELNMRLRNSAVTEFSYTARRHALQTFNALPHLDLPEHASWITYA